MIHTQLDWELDQPLPEDADENHVMVGTEEEPSLAVKCQADEAEEAGPEDALEPWLARDETLLPGQQQRKPAPAADADALLWALERELPSQFTCPRLIIETQFTLQKFQHPCSLPGLIVRQSSWHVSEQHQSVVAAAMRRAYGWLNQSNLNQLSIVLQSPPAGSLTY